MLDVHVYKIFMKMLYVYTVDQEGRRHIHSKFVEVTVCARFKLLEHLRKVILVHNQGGVTINIVVGRGKRAIIYEVKLSQMLAVEPWVMYTGEKREIWGRDYTTGPALHIFQAHRHSQTHSLKCWKSLKTSSLSRGAELDAKVSSSTKTGRITQSKPCWKT